MDQSSNLIQQRRSKLDEIRQLGIDPYPYKYSVENQSAEILEKFADRQDFEEKQLPVNMAGRIMSMRGHGKVGVAHIQDPPRRIQAPLKPVSCPFPDGLTHRSAAIDAG